jgi:hypothetical protein
MLLPKSDNASSRTLPSSESPRQVHVKMICPPAAFS